VAKQHTVTAVIVQPHIKHLHTNEPKAMVAGNTMQTKRKKNACGAI